MVSTPPLIYIILDKEDPVSQRRYVGQNLGGYGEDTYETESIKAISCMRIFTCLWLLS